MHYDAHVNDLRDPFLHDNKRNNKQNGRGVTPLVEKIVVDIKVLTD